VINKIPYLTVIVLLTATIPVFSNRYNTFNLYAKDVPSPERKSEMDKYDVKFYKIDLDVINTSAFISGSTTIDIESKENGLSEIVLQLSSRLTVSSVYSNNQQVNYNHKNDFLRITLPAPLAAGSALSILVSYSGQPEKSDGIKSSRDKKWDQTVLWTISESSNAYKWFPVKQVLTDKADSAYIFITVPKNLKAVSNGKLQNVTDIGNNKLRYEWVTLYPTAYYLLSMVVGDYTEYNLTDTLNGQILSLPNYVYNTPECLPYYKSTIDYTPFLVELFSYLFIPYPFAEEKFGQVMAPFSGGMEHQTITMLGFYSFGLMAHELAHQWFGDYVTCATWQDIWINEGFASYCEYLTYEFAARPEIPKVWLDDAKKMAMRKPNGGVYLTPKETLNEKRLFSNNLTYKKGAVIIHMLRKEIDNDELFFNVLREYLEEYKYNTATGKDFLGILNRVTENDYTWFFDQWYYGKGFPKVYCRYNQKDDRVIMKLNQVSTNSETPFFRVNIDVRLNIGTEYSDTTLVWTTNNQIFNLTSNQPITSIELDPSGELLMLQKGCSVDNSLSEN
jgi:aminopeptidase N